MKLISQVCFFLIPLVLVVSGCVTTTTAQTEKGVEIQRLEPSSLMRFKDVPYPAGFKVLPEKSFILESGGVRAGVLRYSGKTSAESVVRFYKEQMSVFNWVLLNVVEFGDRVLNFERDDESCVVTIKPKGRAVEISISLAPKSPIAPPPKPVVVDTYSDEKRQQK